MSGRGHRPAGKSVDEIEKQLKRVQRFFKTSPKKISELGKKEYKQTKQLVVGLFSQPKIQRKTTKMECGEFEIKIFSQ